MSADLTSLERQNGFTPLSFAARAGHIAIVIALLGGGASVDVPDKLGARRRWRPRELCELRSARRQQRTRPRCGGRAP